MMDENNVKVNKIVLEALDALALALVEHEHVWSRQQRNAYDTAIAVLDDEPIKDPTLQ